MNRVDRAFAQHSVLLTSLGEPEIVSPALLQDEIPGLNIAQAENLAKIVTSLIHSYCKRSYRRSRYRDTFYLQNVIPYVLYLRYDRNVTVETVEEDEEIVNSQDYLVDPETAALNRLSDTSPKSLRYWNGNIVKVTYLTGYTYPTGVPNDLRMAAVALARHVNETKERDFSVRSMALEGVGSVSFLDPNNGGGMIPEPIRHVLNNYVDYTGKFSI